MRIFLAAVLLMVFMQSVNAAVVGKEVDYKSGGVTLKGYLAYDDSIKGKRPGILVVHEWWGHNAYARKRARMLAEMGYVAFALDMYGNGKTAAHPKEAGEFANAVFKDLPVMKARFNAAKDVLAAAPETDTHNMAAIGYCFGGGVVLAMARSGVNLKGVVSFHGMLDTKTPAEKGKVKARVLVLTGGADKFNPPASVAKFKKEMRHAGVRYKLISYPGAMHSFTNPEATELGKKFNLPLAYNPAADRLSWTAMQEFFNKLFIHEPKR